MNENMCPKCQNPSMRTWEELNEEQKMLVERLPASTTMSLEQRKKNRFCPRCWFEQTANFNKYC